MGGRLSVRIDLTAAVGGQAGIGRYARELASALLEVDEVDISGLIVGPSRSTEGASGDNDNDANSQLPVRTAQRIDRLPAPLDRIPLLSVPQTGRRWRFRVALDYALNRSRDSQLDAGDVFHAPDHLLPRLKRPASVITLHDVTFVLFPHAHTLLNRTYQALMVQRFLRHSDAVIAVSETTRSDALRLYGLSAEKVFVVPEGVSAAFRPASAAERVRVAQRYGLRQPFILFVGTIEPRKNLDTLLTAYARMVTRHTPAQLVIAGGLGWRYHGLLERIERFGLGDRIVLPGRIADSDLPALYSAARVVALPSLYEGFGLPALEAMACGTPVVTSNVSALPEIVGEAGLMVPPLDSGLLAGRLGQVIEDDALAARLSQAGVARAAQFTWRRAAEQTADVYRYAANAAAVRRSKSS
jgi:glycosyltransferase involved in cell wall biosynthesis